MKENSNDFSTIIMHEGEMVRLVGWWQFIKSQEAKFGADCIHIGVSICPIGNGDCGPQRLYFLFPLNVEHKIRSYDYDGQKWGPIVTNDTATALNQYIYQLYIASVEEFGSSNKHHKDLS